MGKKRRVGEMLEARGTVGHDVALPWEVETGVAVSVRALVFTSILTEVGGSAGQGRECFLGDSGVGRSVVGCRGDGTVSAGSRGRDERNLC